MHEAVRVEARDGAAGVSVAAVLSSVAGGPRADLEQEGVLGRGLALGEGGGDSGSRLQDVEWLGPACFWCFFVFRVFFWGGKGGKKDERGFLFC